MSKKVLVAMSGGVDSSVAAYKMLEKGYDVIGVTLKLFDGPTKFIEDAKNVAEKLGIKWYLADYSSYFKEVISYFINSYRKGETPNPCAFCNKNAKFVYLFNEMQKNNAEMIVTGHYAKVVEKDGLKYIGKAKNLKKDQSYYLALLDEFQVSLLYFPHGDVESKDEVRELANKIGLKVASKKDSQEVCFLCGKDYREFLKERIDSKRFKKGYLIYNGKKMRQHEGIEFFTIGQRRGLGLNYHEPLYVTNIDAKSGNIYLAKKDDVFKRGVKLRNVNIVNDRKRIFRAKAKIRYRMEEADCMVEILPENKAIILFDEPQFAPTKGQMVAIYQDDLVLGGGFIHDVF
ncbi:tRNA 2-thiouridine(34) synthase MnmA [Deferribacter autotrophicus]|uniref:tRNA-specific 2-thiouridylase MnmA n=1 Tax=Deferribacter autotrophicus TaxID=500465 RepID=A0A5A8F0I9_9BACT|nr:tRNA 2-thiouridine(34) synthase MnmA [Deferribacter autotrophicus]KAA0257378.1 tRNA 2-thiouridine(34) synthase MnmA [Deferribacter autotrophicus]